MKLNGETAVYGIFGYPVKHSKSPTFQIAAFLQLGLNAVYIPFQVKPENLQKAIESIKVLDIKGVNITIPFKEESLKYVDELSEEVRVIGALNTIKNLDGYLIGYNTDCYGFVKGLKELEEKVEGKRVLVIGAGGASKAVIYGLLKEGIDRIYLSNRTVQRAVDTVQKFKEHYRLADRIINPIGLEEIDRVLEYVDIIVNTTSVGLKDSDSPLFDYRRLKPHHTVVDIIYRKTELLQKAEAIGCKYQDGYPMLLYQGARSFEIWTGREAPVEVMRQALLSG